MTNPPMHEPMNTEEALAMLARIGWQAEMTLGELIAAAYVIPLEHRWKVGRAVDILVQGWSASDVDQSSAVLEAGAS